MTSSNGITRSLRGREPSALSLASVIVAYGGSDKLLGCIESVAPQVQTIILVQNGPLGWEPGDALTGMGAKFVSIRNETNLGIAKALNQGFQAALGMGHTHVLAMDQDSQATGGMAARLLNAFQTTDPQSKAAIAAPTIVDAGRARPARFLIPRRLGFFARTPCGPDGVPDATIVISSGAVFDLSVYQRLGGFRDDLFVDYVDTEYCLRARSHGYGIVVCCDAILHHRWGDSRPVRVGRMRVSPTFHRPRRWYYISRNRIPTMLKYGWRFPHWMAFDLLMAVWWLVRMLALEDQRIQKLRAVALGTLDGLIGRMGKTTRRF